MLTQSIKFAVAICLGLVFAYSCSSDNSERYAMNPVDQMIKKFTYDSTFTIILYDMNVEGSWSKTYKHQYHVIRNVNGKIIDSITPWNQVQEGFFDRHANDMGMELASKTKDGKVKKDVLPAGYSNYVGNPQYGHWTTGSNGSSFWEFYGKYAMMSSLFHMMTTPVYRNYYDDYRSNWHGGSYYGPRDSYGNSMYGTYGSAQNNSKSTWTSNPNNKSFSEKVRSRVQPSSSGSRFSSEKKSNSFFSKSSSSKSRGTSRFGSSSSSSRSRGGGRGK